MDNQTVARDQDSITERILEDMTDELREVALSALQEAVECVDKGDVRRHICDMEINDNNILEIFNLGIAEYRKHSLDFNPTLEIIGRVFDYAIIKLTEEAVEKLGDVELEL